jgi:6-phosphogluconolactonase
MTGNLKVFPDTTALARAAAAHFVGIAQASIALNNRFTVALSGGGTPEPMYRLLATPEFASQIDWQHVHLFWSDERCVPPDDPESNYSMAWKSFAGQIPIPKDNIHRILGEELPNIAAERYEQELKDHFKGPRPRFDLILLGLGEDGHTASIFPGSAAIAVSKHLVLAVQHPRTGQWRVTLTLPVINAAANVTFLVAGESKRTMVQVVRSRSKTAEEVPAIGVAPRDGMVLWLCDQTASRP